MAFLFSVAMFILTLVLCPLLPGVVNRCKSRFAGRRGPPLAQLYYDLFKLARKGSVYSDSSTWVVKACPVVMLAGALTAAALTPLGTRTALFFFTGDFLLWCGAFALGRLFLIAGALDVGSSFEGMGASREAWFSALAEPALLLAMTAMALLSGEFSLSGALAHFSGAAWVNNFTALFFLALALFLVTLAENARLPVDDPNTHLELTMIHEVMVLDHGGPDLALINYASALKLWVMGSLSVELVLPLRTGNLWLDELGFLLGMAVFGVAVGAVESCMARLRLLRVPQFLVGAGVLSALSLIMAARAG